MGAHKEGLKPQISEKIGGSSILKSRGGGLSGSTKFQFLEVFWGGN